MMSKTKKERVAIVRGTVALIIGLIIGMAYLTKFFPLDPIKHIALLAAWSTLGWAPAIIIILYGLCEIFLEGDL